MKYSEFVGWRGRKITSEKSKIFFFDDQYAVHPKKQRKSKNTYAELVSANTSCLSLNQGIT
jgi:hypothetical protein